MKKFLLFICFVLAFSTKAISKETTYNNIDDKFKLNENENNILNYLSESISSEIFTSVVSVGE